MSNPIYTTRPLETRGSDALVELALDLRWKWSHSSEEIWGLLDPELWELTQNPWVVLQTVSQERLEAVSADPGFRTRVEELLREKREIEQADAWFQKNHPGSPLKLVAYFSMEYMLGESLPIYSGGLGNVAGDQLKAASDLGVPVVAVGLLYQQGYFRQEIDSHGAQHALYPFNDPTQLPIKPLREENGEWLRLSLAMPGLKLWVRAWEAQVGRLKLYLLDSNDPGNPPAYRGITSELYGGGPELRLKQEIVLGIGGWRLLRALGLRPDVCHLNEGHAAFAVLERARSHMTDHHSAFDDAMMVTRAGNLFTTHTPVAAGFDVFTPELMEKYFRRYAEHALGIGFSPLLAMGRRDPGDAAEPFNMAYLAVRGSARVNGVSRLHGKVSRRIFEALFPRWPEDEIPIGHVTNGVHVPTWEGPGANHIWTAACGEDRWAGSGVECNLRKAPDGELWELRTRTLKDLIAYTRRRLARQRAGQGRPAHEIAEADRIFDPNVLTLGFARRFATYKRPNLLLHDTARLLRILNNDARPVQLILAGKAHPQDVPGQEMIREWHEFLHRPEARSRVVFLSDYDMLLTQQLAQGVDVWMNTPRRPWEASGTSGMKVLVNGGLNLSELDGWWVEAYEAPVGWAIGDGREHGDDPAWDAAEAEAIYDLLEHEIVPAFYDRDAGGIPRRWVAMMRESMARLTPAFSASRTVRQYTEEHYIPAAEAYGKRSADGGKLGAELLDWSRSVSANWPKIRFGEPKVETHDGEYTFEVALDLGGLDPAAVRVELFAEPHVTHLMTRGPQGGYSARVPATRPESDYTARAVPFHESASVPLEAPAILWQR